MHETLHTKRQLFLDLSAALTGHSEYELETTGLVDQYQELLEAILGPSITAELYTHAEAVLVGDATERQQNIRTTLAPSATFGPVILSLNLLWYLGNWTSLPKEWHVATGIPLPDSNSPGRSHTPSALAYVEQLSYRSAQAHPPGAKATGWGSWASLPL